MVAYYLTDHQLQLFMKFSYGEWLQTFATLTFTKISICLLLLRITITKEFIRPLYAAIAILAVSNVVISITWILQCRPHLDKAWNTKLPGKCFSKGQLERIILSQAIISIISDYFLSAFPILILRKVQISFRSKVALCLLMGLGVVLRVDIDVPSTGTLSLIRAVLNYQNVTNDPTWISIPNWYLRTWEVLFGVVAACIPTLRPLYKWLLDEYTQWTHRSKGSNPSTGYQPALERHTIKSADKHNFKPVRPTRPEDILPLQNFEGVGQLGNVERAVHRDDHPKWGSDVSTFKPGLHIHGDLSTNRPGHLKRWDSEAQIGGGHGVEEIEDRI
ncbi:MAG: hypothetical protein L6R40_007573 [Gallowayella cf. fulva]|nr:MAG: hypothetical protein L6R40_007573 [Xanthomendoza cf. fulva]